MKIKFEVTRIDARTEEFIGEGETSEDCMEDAIQQAYDFDYSSVNSDAVEYETILMEEL